MKSLIENILNSYQEARATSKFSGGHPIYQLFGELKDEITNLESISNNKNLFVKFSCGQGNWAAIPWVAIMDKRETTSTMRGTYIVLLFGESGEGCHLKLAQGVTDLKDQYGQTQAIKLLKDKADKVRAIYDVSEVGSFDLSGDPRLEQTGNAARLYESSTILSKLWPTNSVPSDSEIAFDISLLIDCYGKYVDSKDVLEEPVGIEPEEIDPFYEGKKIWGISVGESGRHWNEFHELGIVGIGWDYLGDLKKFSNQEEIASKIVENKEPGDPYPNNDSLCCYQFANEMQIGDLIIAKVGRRKIIGGGIVTSDYRYDTKRNEYKNIREVKWVTTEKIEFPGAGIAVKTLTEISRYPEFRELAETYIEERIPTQKSIAEPYSTEMALLDLFIPEKQLVSIVETAKRKKNIILQGPPGVGKTFVSKRLAFLLMGEKDTSRIEYIQFHQSYSYEDFVQGWRPNPSGSFNLKNGSFYDFCEKAKSDLNRTYVFIIDEINRGNLSKIFGELLMLIENDKRGVDNAIKLTYSETEADRFYVPENVFIIGLMNTADRSLAVVDYALRRRFAFFNLTPQLESEKFEQHIKKANGTDLLVARVRQKIESLNAIIRNQKRDLGPGFQIGHSYFCANHIINSSDDWYEDVVNTEIKPLLEEYWFDDPDYVDNLVSDLLS